MATTERYDDARMTADEAEDSLRQYMQAIDNMTAGRTLRNTDMIYGSVESALLARGHWWPKPEVARPPGLRKLPNKACFWNSAKVARRYARRGYRYAEGMAMSDIGFPCHHGWVLDADNRVIETTWERAGHMYCGIVVPRDLLLTVGLPALYNNELPIWESAFWTRLEAARD